MNNFVYCFDENYNIQGYCSIMSLLKNCENKVNIYIVHQDPETFNEFSNNIQSHKNLKKLTIYKFKNNDYEFPNLNNKHVSEATYYRLFLDEYLPDNIDTFLYLDADAYFIKGFEDLIYEASSNLRNSEFIISALNGKGSLNHERLKLKSGRYFNAGVLLVDYKKWLKAGVSFSLLKELQNKENELIFWDQDLLNMYFDGNFLDLNNSLNYNIYGDQKASKNVLSSISTNATIVHYSGKHKPWSPKGVLSKESFFYNKIYRELFKEKYHIVNVFSWNTIKILSKNLLTLKILKLEYPLSYLYITLKTVLKKKK